MHVVVTPVLSIAALYAVEYLPYQRHLFCESHEDVMCRKYLHMQAKAGAA